MTVGLVLRLVCSQRCYCCDDTIEGPIGDRRWSNAFYEKNMTDFLCECIPMMIFMSQAQCGECASGQKQGDTNGRRPHPT